MGNIMDYLKWRGDLTFSQDAFNEVDNLLLWIISAGEVTLLLHSLHLMRWIT